MVAEGNCHCEPVTAAGRCGHRPLRDRKGARIRADRVVRPYETGRRGRRPLRSRRVRAYGRTGSSAPTRRDVEDAVPYEAARARAYGRTGSSAPTPCHSEPVTVSPARNDRAARSALRLVPPDPGTFLRDSQCERSVKNCPSFLYRCHFLCYNVPN